MTADAFGADAVRDLVEHEAALLDDGRFDDWLALYAPDARYWVPLHGAAQADGAAAQSIADEDLLLLRLRVERLKNPRAHSQRPPSRCQHVLQRPRIEAIDAAAGSATLRTPFVYVEARGDAQLVLTGRYRHDLRTTPDGLRIRLKRVDLLAADRALPAIQLFI